MRGLLTGLAALLLAVVASSAFADDNKKDPDKKDPAPPAEKVSKVGDVAGKLLEVKETDKTIKLEVTILVQKQNLGEVQAYQNCQVQYQQAVARRDYNAAVNLQQQIAYHQQRITTIEKQTKNLDFTGTDDVKIRLTDPPPAYDDKGNLKKRTHKELEELKGDPKSPDFKLPGYPGAFSDLHSGSYVKVTLVKMKNASHAGAKPKDADPAVKEDNLPLASMIEILPDPTAPMAPK